MPSLINPYVLFAILMAVLSAYGAGHHQAYVEQQAEIERISSVMKTEAEAETVKLKREKQDAQNKVDQIRAGIASGAVRLSISASCPTSIASGNSEARAELDAKVADDLVSIAADGDQAIIELNSCIDLYNKMRSIK